MNKGEMTLIASETGRGNQRFLVCDIAENLFNASSSEEAWVKSPIQCMDWAIEWKPDIIVLSFIQISIKEREALVELSERLERNTYTKNCIVLAILPSKHRKLIEDLMQAGVDYIRYIAETRLNSDLTRKLISSMEAINSPERQLEKLCPFLNYRKIDSQHEMTACGAWRNRMVLGGKRLQDLCETENHLHCDYFLNPVTES